MTLHELIAPLPRAALTGRDEVEVSGVRDDSRGLQAGEVFVAVRGETVDGHQFITQAIDAGVAAIVAEEPAGTDLPKGIGWVLVPDTREALGVLAATWNGNPSRDLRVAGVTGTNGKTTTAFLLHGILKATLQRAGLIGTVLFDDGAKEEVATYTTPGTLEMQALLGRMRDNGCQGVAMEVSSQGLVQGRAGSVSFDAVIFTNLTQDHLDYHGSMADYFAAKRLLFDQAVADRSGKKPTAVVNLDDRFGEVLARDYAGRMKVMTYGFGVNCDFKAGRVKQNRQGMEFQLDAQGRSFLVRLPLIGRFNVYNALAALGAAVSMRIPLREAVVALGETRQVPGRLECVGSVEGATVFVDYAHTPDALQSVCKTLRELNPSRLITVFGCGGNRDREKRPVMGKAASVLSDFCYVTSDNPRREDPDTIIAEIKRGIVGTSYESIPDRATAIRKAILEAGRGDLVLIAGKGHETYQELADGRLRFDDRSEARAVMNEKRIAARREEP